MKNNVLWWGQLNQLGIQGAKILFEPEGRNTASAIALAALQAISDGSGLILIVMPADHVVLDEVNFKKSCQRV